MNVLSLFDGISCGQAALKRVGIQVGKYYASEIDKHSIWVTQNNYPETIQLGDVAKIDGRKFRSIELVMGGSPCQGFSSAGKQLNFADPRSRLFFEYVRILEEASPKYFLLENVKMKKEYQDIITRYLGVKPVEINSADIVPMRRARLYWTNIPFTTIAQKNTHLVNFLDDNVAEKYFLSQEKFQKLTWTDGKNTYIKNLPNKPMMIHEGDGIVLSRPWQVYMPVVSGKSHCIRAANPDDVGVVVRQNGQMTARKFTVSEMEQLQTLPVGYTNYGLTEAQRKKCIGNGWTVDVIAHIFSGLKE